MTREELDELYHAATGNGPSRDRPVTWAAETLDVSRRTVARWISGETSPTARQITRLRIAARAGELGRAREAGGWPARLRRWFDSRRALEAIAAAAAAELGRRVRANRTFDVRGASERDSVGGGRADRHSWLFSPRRGAWLAGRDPLAVPTLEDL